MYPQSFLNLRRDLPEPTQRACIQMTAEFAVSFPAPSPVVHDNLTVDHITASTYRVECLKRRQHDSLANSNKPEAEEIKDGNKIKLELKPFALGGYADIYRGTWNKPDVGEIVVAVKVLRMKGTPEDMPTNRNKQRYPGR
ncbi:hypothetical protein FRB96_005341 [Tulasnella sp. 330]|nr:hypothetical protein FRB96_005341 [Tulasnella sp. 330]KAG8870632.1 hypothetical protein FRB97_009580 [Tulasnella sp. 331]